jgi:hypothetical protein
LEANNRKNQSSKSTIKLKFIFSYISILSEKGLFRVIPATFAFLPSTSIETTAQIKTKWNVTSNQADITGQV